MVSYIERVELLQKTYADEETLQYVRKLLLISNILMVSGNNNALLDRVDSILLEYKDDKAVDEEEIKNIIEDFQTIKKGDRRVGTGI